MFTQGVNVALETKPTTRTALSLLVYVMIKSAISLGNSSQRSELRVGGHPRP